MANDSNIKYRLWKNFMRFGKALGCHQRRDRSFFMGKYQCFVCARCTGILLGEFLIWPLVFIWYPGNMLLNVGLCIPLVLDGVIQLKTQYESNNIKRVMTGIMAGYAMMSTFVILLLTVVDFFVK